MWIKNQETFSKKNIATLIYYPLQIQNFKFPSLFPPSLPPFHPFFPQSQEGKRLFQSNDPHSTRYQHPAILKPRFPQSAEVGHNSSKSLVNHSSPLSTLPLEPLSLSISSTSSPPPLHRPFWKAFRTGPQTRRNPPPPLPSRPLSRQ